MTREGDDHEESPESDPDGEDSGLDDTDEDLSSDRTVPPATSFQLPAGFAQSLMPNVGDALAGLLGPIREQMRAAMPDIDALAKNILAPYSDQLRVQMASIRANFPTFVIPAIELPVLTGFGVGPETTAMLKRVSKQHTTMFKDLQLSLRPLFDPELLRGFNRVLLPPNLKEYAEEIQARQVHEFLVQEGIPLYLVPRGRTAFRLLRAQNGSARRQVLGDCYESILDDCAAVLERVGHETVGDEVKFALDGLGAMRAGHVRSAQAMFTVTLDTLIYRFYPDPDARRAITTRKKGADVPDAIDEMGVHEAMVWLPIWNAHEQFWKHKGDSVPHYYSRHASVHGVSARQFSKRNCVQVLMLVTSLIGYADRLSGSATRTSV